MVQKAEEPYTESQIYLAERKGNEIAVFNMRSFNISLKEKANRIKGE